MGRFFLSVTPRSGSDWTKELVPYYSAGGVFMSKHVVLGDRVNASVVILREGVLVIDTSVDPDGARQVQS